MADSSAEAPIGTIWSSSPWMIKVGTSIFFRSSREVGLRERLDAVVAVLVAAHHSLRPPGLDHSLRDLGPRPIEAEEGATGDVEEELRAVGQIGLAKAVEDLHRQAAGICRGLHHDRRHGAHQHRPRDAAGAMPADVARHLAAAGGVADHRHVLHVQRREQLVQVVGIGVHVVALPGLAGAAMAAPVVGDAAKAVRCQVEHLRLPCVRAQRPAVAEADDRAGAPVLVVDLRAVLGGEGAHGSPFGVGGGVASRGRSGRGRRVGGACRQREAERRCGRCAANQQPAAGGRQV